MSLGKSVMDTLINYPTQADISTKTHEELLDIAWKILGDDTSLKQFVVVQDREDEVGLVLLHYRRDMTTIHPGVRYIRGIVIDVVRGYVVCTSPIYYPSVTATQVSVLGGNYVLDSEELSEPFSLGRTTIIPFEEQVYIKIFLHRGKMYFSSSTRIDCASHRSRWEDFSEEFTSMYEKFGGPGQEDLYGDQTECPVTYTLGIIDPSLNMTNISFNKFTSDASEGYIRFDKTEIMWTPDQPPFNLDDPESIDVEPVAITLCGERIRPQYNLSIAAANNHLKWGFHGESPVYEMDPSGRLGWGEAIVFIERDEYGRISRQLQVKSSQYAYREILFEREKNVYKQFVSIMADIAGFKVKTPEGRKAFSSYVPLIRKKKNAIRNDIDITLDDVELFPEASLANMSLDDRRHVGWLNFLINAAPYFKRSIVRMMNRFTTDINDLKAWLVRKSGSESMRLTEPDKATRRVHDIITQANKQKATTKLPKGSKINAITYNISRAIDRERAVSLYQLIRLMREMTESTTKYMTDISSYTRMGSSIPAPERPTLSPTISPSCMYNFPEIPSSAPAPTKKINPLFLQMTNESPPKEKEPVRQIPLASVPIQSIPPSSQIKWSDLMGLK